jgi:hypothetical protein
MRRYIDIKYEKDRDIIDLMHILSSPISSEESYRNSFYQLGKALGTSLNQHTNNNYGETMLACASEDADWLARGVLESLSQKQVSLAVFWNERITLDEINNVEYSPIIKSYIEPIEGCQTLILVKSIISTSCVVKTQLTRLVNTIKPHDIYIVSPVMYKDASSRLEKEFPISISKKFHFFTFAIDTIKDIQGHVLPGVGGMVYPKLGLGDSHEKNKYVPNLVKERVTLE